MILNDFYRGLGVKASYLVIRAQLPTWLSEQSSLLGYQGTASYLAIRDIASYLVIRARDFLLGYQGTISGARGHSFLLGYQGTAS